MNTSGPPGRDWDYVLLMRHAEHDDGVLTADGRESTTQVASRLLEWVADVWGEHPDRRVEVQAAPTSESVETARRVCAKLGDRASVRQPGHVLLGKDSARRLQAYSADSDEIRAVVAQLDREASRCAGAVLLVANDPLVSWLAAGLTARGRRASAPSRPLGIARTEVLCLARRRDGVRWRTTWSIAAHDERHEQPLREKVKSKMATATALGSLLVVLIVFLLQDVLSAEPNGWHWACLASLICAGILYFATLLLYDTLQMPTRFWTSSPPSSGQGFAHRLRHGKPGLARPPSSTARVLHAAMLQIWMWMFVPATVLLGIGVAFLVLAQSTESPEVVLTSWQSGAGLMVIALLSLGWVALQRPHLGASD